LSCWQAELDDSLAKTQRERQVNDGKQDTNYIRVVESFICVLGGFSRAISILGCPHNCGQHSN